MRGKGRGSKNGPKMAQKGTGVPQKIPKNHQKIETRGQTRTLDSSQRDMPVYVVFLQGLLTVPVGCLAK